MTMKDVVEALDVLRSETDRSQTEPIIGQSNNPFYSTDKYKQYVWPWITVLDPDVDKIPGQFSYLLFSPADVNQRSAKAASMYPQGRVQIEIDFFHPREDVPW